MALATPITSDEGATLVDRWFLEHGDRLQTEWRHEYSLELMENEISVEDAMLIAVNIFVSATEIDWEELAEFTPFIGRGTFVDGRHEWYVSMYKPAPDGEGYIDTSLVIIDSFTGKPLFVIHGGRG